MLNNICISYFYTTGPQTAFAHLGAHHRGHFRLHYSATTGRTLGRRSHRPGSSPPSQVEPQPPHHRRCRRRQQQQQRSAKFHRAWNSGGARGSGASRGEEDDHPPGADHSATAQRLSRSSGRQGASRRRRQGDHGPQPAERSLRLSAVRRCREEKPAAIGIHVGFDGDDRSPCSPDQRCQQRRGCYRYCSGGWDVAAASVATWWSAAEPSTTRGFHAASEQPGHEQQALCPHGRGRQPGGCHATAAAATRQYPWRLQHSGTAATHFHIPGLSLTLCNFSKKSYFLPSLYCPVLNAKVGIRNFSP